MSSRAFRYYFQTNRWIETGPLPPDVGGLQPSRLPNGKVMALGVVRSTQKPVALVFDPSTMLWTSGGETPADNLRFDRKVISLSSGNVLVFGLSNQKRGGWIYNYEKNTWSNAQVLPIAVQNFAYGTNLKNGSVLVIVNDNTMIGKWVGLVYEPTTDSWTTTGKLPSDMTGSPSGFTTLADGTVFILGFQQYPYIATAAVTYDPDTKTWSKAGEVPNNLSGVGALTQLPNGMVLTSSKDSADRGVFSAVFNPATKEWKVGSKLSDEYSGLAIFGVRPDGTAWGMGYRYSLNPDILVYSPTLGKWTKVGDMPENIIAIQPTGRTDGARLIFTRTTSVTEVKMEAYLYFP